MNWDRVLVTILSCLLSLLVTGQVQVRKDQIQGVYGNPKPLWDQGYNLSDLGVNAIFVHSGAINSEMIERAHDEGLKIYAEFAILNGKNYVENHPEAWAINNQGERVEAASWFMGVCPTEPGFRKFRFDQLRQLLQLYELDGIWMDYVHWHAQFEEPEPILPETCFCEHCLRSFSQFSGIELPDVSTVDRARWIFKSEDEAWRDWRCQVIVNWSSEVRKIINEIRPNTLLGLFHCPWSDEEFDGARRRILGLDYNLLRDAIDVFSPMVYHTRMGRAPEWVGTNLEWFYSRLKIGSDKFPQIWPIVQASNEPAEITPEEFELVLKSGLKEGTGGVMMFTTYAVAAEEAKIQVMKKVYTQDRED